MELKIQRVILDKIKGGLFGVAIGDALGGTTEFLTENEIQETYGTVDNIIGGGVWDLTPGEVTDDTQMTIAVARGIITNSRNPIQAIGENFFKWYKTKPKDVGIIIASVLNQFQGNWFQTAESVHYNLDEMSAGNGSLMRCLPVSLGYNRLADIIKFTTAQSKMTHFDDQAADACLIYNKIAYRLLNNEPLKLSIEKEVKGTIYENALKTEPDVPADGYVVHTLLWVIYYLYHLEDFKEIAIKATNKGGDSDTIAAIACGLKGLEVGYHKLPDQYKNKILVKADLTKIANELFQIRLAKKE